MIPVYGWDKNIYPNIMRGQTIFFKDSPDYLKDFFTLSRCPYVEITRLNWYTIDGLYRDVNQEPLGQDYNGPQNKRLEKSEKIFLDNPGEQSLSQMSDTYSSTLKTNLKSNRFDDKLPVLWKRSLQERSKLHKLNLRMTIFTMRNIWRFGTNTSLHQGLMIELVYTTTSFCWNLFMLLLS